LAKVLDRDKAPSPVDIVAGLRAGRAGGRAVLAQLRDIVALWRGFGRLKPSEYFAFRLNEPRFDDAARRAFLGERGQAALFRRFCRRNWYAVAHDKLLYYATMQGLGFRVPAVRALAHAARPYPGALPLRDAGAVAAYLRQAPYPLFGKPVAALYSVGTAALDGYDATSDKVLFGNGAASPAGEFAGEVWEFARQGYLFQERLEPHPAVRAVCGRIATVRVVVLLDRGVPEVFRALWKIPAGSNMADNFWRSGNMLAALDGASGRILRVVQGVGTRQRDVEAHPDTGVPLVGFALPDWDKAMATVLAAAAYLPGFGMQSWDVALCADGPMLLELNVVGDVNLAQHAFGRGVFEGRLAELYRQGRR